MHEYRNKIKCYSCGKVLVNPEYEKDFKEVLVSIGDDETKKLVPYCLFCFEKWKKEKKNINTA